MWFVSLIGLFGFVASATSDEVDGVQVLRALVSSRDALVSGEYTAKFRVEDSMRPADSPPETPLIDYVEDYDISLRFDHRRRVLAFMSQSAFPLEDKSRERIQYIKGTEALYRSTATRNSISINSLSAHTKVLTYPNPDVRGMGLAHFPEIFSGTMWEDFKSAYTSYTSSEVQSAERSSETGLITLRLSRSGLSKIIVIDEQRGFWPIKLTLLMPAAGDRVELETEVDLLQVDEVWVPDFVTMRGGTRLLTIDFDWQSVNKEISDEYLHYRSFDMLAGAEVLDFRQPGAGILVETISEPQRGTIAVRPTAGWSRVSMIVLALIGLLVGSFVIWRIRRAAR